MQWELITNIILILSFIILGVFVILAIYQWITRKSFMKIDRQLRWMPLPLALMTITYFIFDKLIILNTRPNGSGESSFPSTHAMIVTTIFFVAIIVLPKYIKSRAIRIILDIIMFILVALTCTGRVLSNMHWPLDVFGAIGFALIFSEIYLIVIKIKRKKK
ncbi:phosphatase PAP2 family protein [Candidatus Saccharibacteria bacterium]|nr:phosphatase PAP2 family protein [Candidatus Saccharibacteria bacterium]